MSAAQVTEEHIYTTAKVGKAYVAGEDAQAAQLIADSEAKAVAEWQESVYLKGEAIDSLLIECDRLRAEIKSCGELSCDECNARTAALIAERDQLRAIFPQICEALGNGSCCAPDISLDFLQSIPNEVAGVVAKLRAEVERLKKQIKDDNRSYGCELRDPYGTIWEQATKDHDRAGKAERALAELREWQAGVIANERLHHAERKQAIARAERAESELHALRLVCGTTDADKFSTWVDRAIARAEKAEAELAKAKAVLASIEEDGTEEHNAAVGLRQELATERARLDWLELRGPWDSWNGFGETGITLRENIRAAIDAVMKEGA